MTRPLPQSVRLTLPICDPERAERVRSRLPEAVLDAWSDGAAFLDAVMAASPYLGRLMVRRSSTLAQLAQNSPERVVEAACAAARAAGELDDETEALQALREAKADFHLATALADLSGFWSLERTLAAISGFADAALFGAVHSAARQLGFAASDPARPVPGYFVLALGKLGTRTLNYSSDIDLVVLFEPDLIEMPEGKEVQKTLNRLTQTWTRLLQEVTGDGYVFRVDLRLRPDPGSTPVALSADAARHYFEAVGQNWERAAYAKARPCAGDLAAGAAFCRDLEPFIWRRALDFAAVEDIRSLAKQIQSVGRRAELVSAGHDVKLGRGGIREIEFYAQVLQLVFGGRRRELRVADTVSALGALAQAELIGEAEAQRLIEDYGFLRNLEHRIQMLDDEQTQTLPLDTSARCAVAAMMGVADLAAFDADVVKVLTRVHTAFSAQFSRGDSLATKGGSLVLTGVEATPDTLATLQGYGFSQPDRVWSQLAGWAAGRARAARTERARRLFSRLAPILVEAIAATGDPDATFARFSAFFEGLPSGVQVLSLLVNYPELADELIAILGLAPRLAESLARRPELLDVMLEPSFAAPLQAGEAGALARRMQAAAGDEPAFEAALNQARRVAREERLRIGSQMLLGRASAGDAGRAYAELADAAVVAMAGAAEAEVSQRHGMAPGRWAVLGLGKLGGRELSADSDLDLMVVYEADAASSEGPRSLGSVEWFARFAQRLVAALSAPTEEGELFPVDMALRPSGSAGPIAVSLGRFAAYYESEAWTWERMALTRARVIASHGLEAPMEAALQQAIARTVAAATIREDAAAMRARLLRDKPARSPWDLKMREGGLVEIEFVAQTAQLIGGRQASPSTIASLQALAADGALPEADVEALVAACRDYMAVTQLIRLAHGSGFDPEDASQPFAERLSAAAGCTGLGALAARLEARAATVRALFEKHVGLPAAPGDG